MPASRPSLRLFIAAAGTELFVPLLMTAFPPSGNRFMVPVIALGILVLTVAGRIGTSYVVIGAERPDVPPMPKIVMVAVVASALSFLAAMLATAFAAPIASPVLLTSALAMVAIHVILCTRVASRKGFGAGAGWLVALLQVGAVVGAAADRTAAAVIGSIVFLAVFISTISAINAHARTSDDR